MRRSELEWAKERLAAAQLPTEEELRVGAQNPERLRRVKELVDRVAELEDISTDENEQSEERP